MNKNPYEFTHDIKMGVFEKMKYCCMYGYISYDEDRIADWTCHHKDNKPGGCSWGNCNASTCPILKGE